MQHTMNLRPIPFGKIKDGTKTIELRLYDEKRRKIAKGDTICFINTENSEKLSVTVKELFIYRSFKELYADLPLTECGYTETDVCGAKPEDMLEYYPIDKQDRYGVIGIQVEPI